MGESWIVYFIRDLHEEAELKACEKLQRDVWQFQTPDVVSARMLQTCLDFSGIVLGAFLEDGRIIGFVFSFPALWGELPIQHSHMMAVLPEFQNSGVGESLKREQLKRVRKKGIKIITWTFDPLECRNAHLNLNKLGVVVRRYYKNLYGKSTTSELQSGLGTDRFLAEWYVDERTSTGPQRETPLQPTLLKTYCNRSGLLVPEPAGLKPEADRLYLEIPWNIQELKKKDKNVAVQWREVTRNILSEYLTGEYQVDALIRRCVGGQRARAFYQLTRISQRSLP